MIWQKLIIFRKCSNASNGVKLCRPKWKYVKPLAITYLPNYQLLKLLDNEISQK